MTDRIGYINILRIRLLSPDSFGKELVLLSMINEERLRWYKNHKTIQD